MRKKNQENPKGVKTMLLSFVAMVVGMMSCGQAQETKVNDEERKRIEVPKREVATEVFRNEEAYEEIEWVQMDSIVFDHTLYEDCESCSHPKAHYCIPRLVANDAEYSATVEKINNYLYDLLKYEEGDAVLREDWCENVCHGVSFNYSMVDTLLHICMYVTYCSNRGDEEQGMCELFDLLTGEKIKMEEIPFSALFSTEGYFAFLDERGWADSIKSSVEREFKRMCEEMPEKEAREYMGDIEERYRWMQFSVEYESRDDNVKFSRDMSYISLPWFYRCFEPYYADNCDVYDMKPYLSSVGEEFLIGREKMDPIVEAMWKNDLSKQIEDNLFLEMYTGRNETETCRIAINYDNPQNVIGYLYDLSEEAEEIKGKLIGRTVLLYSSNLGEIEINLDSLYSSTINGHRKFAGFTANREW